LTSATPASVANNMAAESTISSEQQSLASVDLQKSVRLCPNSRAKEHVHVSCNGQVWSWLRSWHNLVRPVCFCFHNCTATTFDASKHVHQQHLNNGHSHIQQPTSSAKAKLTHWCHRAAPCSTAAKWSTLCGSQSIQNELRAWTKCVKCIYRHYQQANCAQIIF